MGLVSLVHAADVPVKTRAEIEDSLRITAERHFAAGKEMDTRTVLEVHAPFEAVMPAHEMAKFYEDSYLAEKKKAEPGTWSVFAPTAGWIVAVLTIAIAVLHKRIEKLFECLADWAWSSIRRRGARISWVRNANLRHYCSSLIERYSRLRLAFSRRELKLSSIFVPLRVASSPDQEEIDAYEAMRRYRKLVVTGNPGSGKSVLLAHLALRFAQLGYSEIDRRTIPILLPLHRIRTSLEAKSLEKHFTEILEELKMPDAKQFLSDGLNDGSLMLLFDGLDEVASDLRDDVVAGIRSMLTRSAGCRAVITCRDAVYHNEFLEIADEHLTLADFADQQINAFLEPWREFMPAGRSVEVLVENLRDRPRIMQLARNPLQLTMICTLYADEHEGFTLPHSRTEFYQRATQLLLDRKPEVEDRNRFSAAEKGVVLESLGLFFQRKGLALAHDADKRSVPYEQVFEEIGSALSKLGHSGGEDRRFCLEEIIERSGLLMRLDGGVRIGFAHLTIQEYYASRAFGGDGAALLLDYRKDPSHWREVVRLWCGGDHDCADFVREIFSFDTTMALECVADSQRLDDSEADRVLLHFQDKLAEYLLDAQKHVMEAYAAVASSPKPRGKKMFRFLVEQLEAAESTETQQTLAEVLAYTNLPEAASVLGRVSQLWWHLEPILAGMGDLALDALGGMAKDGNVKAVDRLYHIGTPQASRILVEILAELVDPKEKRAEASNEVLNHVTWALAILISKPEVMRGLETPAKILKPPVDRSCSWIWAPFPDPAGSGMSVLIEHLALLLGRSKESPFFPRVTSGTNKEIRYGLVERRLATALVYIRPPSGRVDTDWARSPIRHLEMSAPKPAEEKLSRLKFGIYDRNTVTAWLTMFEEPKKRRNAFFGGLIGILAAFAVVAPCLFFISPALWNGNASEHLRAGTDSWVFTEDWRTLWWIRGLIILHACGCLLIVLVSGIATASPEWYEPDCWKTRIFRALFSPLIQIFSLFAPLWALRNNEWEDFGKGCLATIRIASPLAVFACGWFRLFDWSLPIWMAWHSAGAVLVFLAGNWVGQTNWRSENPFRGLFKRESIAV